MTRAFNIEGLVRLQNYMGGKTLSDAQFFAVLNADVVEMIDGEESTTKRRYFRIAENDESITFSCILGSSQQQMVVTKATKQLDVTTTEIGGAIAPGSITTEMLADEAVTREKIASKSIDNLKLDNGSVSNRTLQMGAVTSEKLAPGLDVSGLFFILPEGTQFPYTLTEGDKAKLNAATVLILPTTRGATPFQRSSSEGVWCSLRYVNTLWTVTVSERSISAPVSPRITDDLAVKFTGQTLSAEQKAQARANIESADAGLFFILPEGTQFPYTLTEDDKTKLANAKFLMCVSTDGSIMVLSHPASPSYAGSWFGLYSTSRLSYSGVTESTINAPTTIQIYDPNSVRFNTSQTLTAEQKLQARTNIGAAEDPNTSGASPATLEEPIL